MGPGPSRIGYIINDCTIICADCLDDEIERNLPLSIDAAIYDETYSFSHDLCEACQEVLDPDVERCDNPDCYHCGHRLAIDEAIEILKEAQQDILSESTGTTRAYGRFQYLPLTVDEAYEKVERIIEYLEDLK
jgi:hypothetical protein